MRLSLSPRFAGMLVSAVNRLDLFSPAIHILRTLGESRFKTKTPARERTSIHANRTQRPEKASGRDWRCRDGGEDRDRRNSGQQQGQERKDAQRESWRGSTDIGPFTRTEDGDCQKGGFRTVGVMPYSAIKIANEFIRLAREQGGQPLTPLQLIKLTYMAHGWGFVFLNNEAILNEPVQAWQYGPVLPSLYYAVRSHRSAPVLDAIPGDSDPQPLADRVRELVAAVYQRYKHLSGTQLSSMTHMPNTPWSRVWHERGQNAVIPNEAIAAHYRERFDALAAQ